MDNQATTFLAIVQAWHFSRSAILPECQMKQLPRKSQQLPLDNWRRLPGNPHTTWMKTWNPITSPWMKQLHDMAQNRPLWRLLSTFGVTHLVVYDRKDLGSVIAVMMLWSSFLPAWRYTSAGPCESNVSVRPSVRLSLHTPVLCRNEES